MQERDIADTPVADQTVTTRRDPGDREAAQAVEQARRDPRSVETPAEARADRETGLLPPDSLQELRARWEDVQVGFVDQPRRSVEEASKLVSEVVDLLTDTFTRERGRLEQVWTRGENVSTEDLRVALQRYRSFFNKLLMS